MIKDNNKGKMVNSKLLNVVLIIAVIFFNQGAVFSNNKGKSFIVGYSKNIFRGFNINDAKVAASFFENELVKDTRRESKNSSIVINSANEVIELIKADKLDFVSLTSVEYLIVKQKIEIQAYCAPVARDNVQNRILLLVREDSGINSVMDLKGKKIVLSTSLDEQYSPASMWLQINFWRNKIKNIFSFLSSVKIKDNPSIIVSEVFFKNSDACIIYESEFETLTELNPQLGKQLKVLQASDPILTEVGCYTENSAKDPDLKVVLNTTYNLHLNPHGKNLLKLLKIKQLLPYKEEYIKSVEMLYKEYESYKKKGY